MMLKEVGILSNTSRHSGTRAASTSGAASGVEPGPKIHWRQLQGRQTLHAHEVDLRTGLNNDKFVDLDHDEGSPLPPRRCPQQTL
jgi:hypothetical protein